MMWRPGKRFETAFWELGLGAIILEVLGWKQAFSMWLLTFFVRFEGVEGRHVWVHLDGKLIICTCINQIATILFLLLYKRRHRLFSRPCFFGVFLFLRLVGVLELGLEIGGRGRRHVGGWWQDRRGHVNFWSGIWQRKAKFGGQRWRKKAPCGWSLRCGQIVVKTHFRRRGKRLGSFVFVSVLRNTWKIIRF